MSAHRGSHGLNYLLIVRVVITAVATVMLALIFAPNSLWRAPTDDFTAAGFDPTLMYSNASKQASAVVRASYLSMRTSSGGDAVVHLVSSPLSFESRFTIVIERADVGASPTTVAITSPYLNQQYRLAFTSGPGREVEVQTVKDGQVATSRVVGNYEVGEPYHVTAAVDRTTNTAALRLDSAAPASRGVYVSDDGRGFESHVITRRGVQVTPGRRYVLSTEVTPNSRGLAGISIAWYDEHGKRLKLDSDWSPLPADPTLLRNRVLSATAPDRAVTAVPELAVASSGTATFSTVSLRQVGEPSNLLSGDGIGPNSSIWRREQGSSPLDVRTYTQQHLALSVSTNTFPGLFGSLRMALTLQTPGGSGETAVYASDYSLAVPHQLWLATRIDDIRARLLSIALASIATGALAVEVFLRRRSILDRLRRPRRPRAVLLTRNGVLCALAVVLYGATALVLSHLGSLNADVVGARIWTYVAAYHGPADLYFLPNVASAEAVQWNGAALQEAGFPYGPTMAYVFGALAVIYRWGVSQPALGVPDTTSIDLLLRIANTVFGLLAAVLVVLIVRSLRIARRVAIQVGIVFLLAPALAIANAVWATTQTMSMVFLLGAVYAIQRRGLTVAWLLLLATMMTRPQNLVSAAVLAVWLVSVTPLRRTVRALSTSVAVVFVAILPLTLASTPSLPLDITLNALFLHVGNGNDAWTVPVSWGAPGPWPLVSMIFGHASAVDSMLFPATTPLVGGVSYFEAGSILFGVFLLALLAITLIRRRRLAENGNYLLIATLAVLALLQLKTGAPTYHMLQPAALSFLLIRALPKRAYVFVVTTLSVTTAWSMLALGMYWLSAHPIWSTGLFRPDTALADVLLWSVNNEEIVAIACIANTAVIVVLAHRALYPIRSPAGLDHVSVNFRTAHRVPRRPRELGPVETGASSA